jgi:hypothetical protein
MANCIGHGEQGETKRKGYANQTNTYVRESGRNNCTAATPKGQPKRADGFGRELF